MANLDWLGGAIGGVGSAISSFVSARQSAKNVKMQIDAQRQENEKNRVFNSSEAAKSRQFNQTMFDAANAYNSPAAQMARYKEAGLNPNLIYGQNNATASPVSASGSASSSGSISPVGFQPLDLSNAANIAADTALKQAQARKLNTESNTEEINQKWIDLEKGQALQIGQMTILEKDSLIGLNEQQRNKLKEEVTQIQKSYDLIQSEIEKNKALATNLTWDSNLKFWESYVRANVADIEIEMRKLGLDMTRQDAQVHLPFLYAQISQMNGIGQQASEAAKNSKYYRENQAYWDARNARLTGNGIIATTKLTGKQAEWTDTEKGVSLFNSVVNTIGTQTTNILNAVNPFSKNKDGGRRTIINNYNR